MRMWISIIAICALFSCRAKNSDDSVRLSNYLLEKHYITSRSEQIIKEASEFFLNGTPWKGKANVNRQYNSESVNFYLIDGTNQVVLNDPGIEKLIGNCAYVGSNIIIVDVAYLESFLDTHKVFRDRFKTMDFLYDQDCFVYWVIGHELGHLICGHLKGEFEPGSLDTFVKTSSLDNQLELQADSFFVASLLKDKRVRQSSERLMMAILNAEIDRKTGGMKTAGVGLLYDYTNKKLVEYARQPSHPEYVVRLARILELSSKMSADSGMYNLVEGFIRNLRLKDKPPPS